MGKNDVRENIIHIAQDIFGHFGFKKTTMDEIAEASHKAKSSVYHYFKSKEEIFKIIVEREGETLRNVLKQELAKAKDPQEKIRLYVLTRMREINRTVNYYNAVMDVYLEQYAFIERVREDHDKLETSIIREILKEGIDKGIFRENIDIDALAHVFLVGLKGLEYEWMKAKDLSSIEKTINDLTGYILDGIVKR
jgi:AcrR family transcriptional regulator